MLPILEHFFVSDTISDITAWRCAVFGLRKIVGVPFLTHGHPRLIATPFPSVLDKMLEQYFIFRVKTIIFETPGGVFVLGFIWGDMFVSSSSSSSCSDQVESYRIFNNSGPPPTIVAPPLEVPEFSEKTPRAFYRKIGF